MGVKHGNSSLVSKMFLPDAFTGSNDFESYITLFRLLAELQYWKRTIGEIETD